MRSTFTSDMSALNNLDLKAWLLAPGMEFGAVSEWWGGKAKRRSPHSGVDLRFYRTDGGVRIQLKPGTSVTAPFDGTVARMVRDFVAVSVFLVHDMEKDGMRLVSGIGHIAPQRMLRKGLKVKAAAPLGSIAAAREGSGVPPHLHITLALIGAEIKPDTLSWEMLEGRGPGIRLLDPRRFF